MSNSISAYYPMNLAKLMMLDVFCQSTLKWLSYCQFGNADFIDGHGNWTTYTWNIVFQALNNLQSTYAGFGYVNAANVFKVSCIHRTPNYDVSLPLSLSLSLSPLPVISPSLSSVSLFAVHLFLLRFVMNLIPCWLKRCWLIVQIVI